ncbi:ArsR family transcriptional regulator [Halomicrobium sp. IBSBa]|uniref:hypothetical protein n=1 Tax=Halomicrobium sp. IBSBa TaxID=2778916 RepID=UPI001ABF9C90|nr:hypothetical protein [Halomicrobium sp. IBSBa]MBO4247772.1 ArsR family transcriptional regulator [Halomicrobium sp. IBSBa]
MDDEAYLALADEQRRGVLLALLDEPTVDIDVLIGNRAEPLRQISLHHQHLPLLEQMGYAEWNKDAERVSRGPQFETIQPLVEFHGDEVGAWSDRETAPTDSVTVD